MDEDSISKKRRLTRERQKRWRARQSQATLDRLRREDAERHRQARTERAEVESELLEFARRRGLLLRKKITDSFISDQLGCPKNQRKKTCESDVAGIPLYADVNSPKSLECKPMLLPFSYEDHNGENANQIGENIKSLEILKNVKVEIEEESEEKEPTTCDFCKKQCQCPSDLERHTKADHSMLFNCSFCKQTFASEWNRQKHQWCYKDNIFSCHVCNGVFSSNCQLTAHVQNIHSIGQTKGVHHCGECGKCFSEKIRLANHTKIVQTNQLLTLSCDFCDEEFYVDRDLVQHVRSIHENKADSMDTKPTISELNEEDHFCNRCESRFIIESHLKEHLHNRTCSSWHFPFHVKEEEISDHDEASLVTHSVEPT